jgi:hypothetical protein
MYGSLLYGSEPYGDKGGKALQAYTLTTSAAEFTYSASDISITRGWGIDVDPASFTLTGSDILLLKDSLLHADKADYSLQGVNALLNLGKRISVTTGNYLLTGAGITANKGYKILLSPGSFNLTLSPASFIYNYRFKVEKVVYELKGNRAKLNGRLDLPGAPRIQIGSYFIDLPFCQQLTETYLPEFGPSKKLFTTGRITRELKGFYYAAQLDYSRYAEKEMLKYVQKLYQLRNTSFRLYPRSDRPYNYFNCELDEESLDMAQLPFHQAHKNVILRFRGLDRFKQIDFEGASALTDTQYIPILDGDGNALLGGLL